MPRKRKSEITLDKAFARWLKLKTRTPRKVLQSLKLLKVVRTGDMAMVAFWSMLAAIVLVRFWGLNEQPGEVYGDITTVYQYIKDIFIGVWPFYFSLSAGPLYHYLAFPIVWLIGLNYFGLKVASALAGLGVVLFTYLFARRVGGRPLAILAAFITGISSWLLIFSRLGNFPIIVPLLTSAMLWLLVRYIQERRPADLFASGAVAILGLLAYPQAYFLAPALFVTLLVLHVTGFRVKTRNWLRLAAVCALVALPFAYMVFNDPGALTGGYLGDKLQATGDALGTLAGNVTRAFGAYNISGDIISRLNPLGRPHLDFISGILFLIGIYYWVRPERRRFGLALLIPFVILHIPSILTLNAPDDVPSATRTVGVAPIAYLLVAGGLMHVYNITLRRYSHSTALGFSALLLLGLTVANLNSYFVNYLGNLPYQNTPVARLVQEYTDLLPANTHIYIVGCCWEEGMPEPMSIEHEMLHPEYFLEIRPDSLSCEGLDLALDGPAVLIWSHKDLLPNPNLAACAERFPGQLYTAPSGLPVFNAAPVLGLREVPLQSDAGPQPSSDPNLLSQSLEWDGQVVFAYYSPADIGRIEDVVDHNFESIFRGAGANPVVIEFQFAEPRPASLLRISLGTMFEFTIRVVLAFEDGTTAELENFYQEQPNDPTIEIELPESESPIAILHVEITDHGMPPAEGYHIHVREFELE